MNIMKHIRTIVLLSTALLLSSCNFLDFDETSNRYEKEDIYAYFSKTKSMLTHVYSFMPQDFGTIGGAMRDCGCDDAEFGNTAAAVQFYGTNTWSPIKTLDDNWKLYNGIRAANAFIEDIKNVDFSRYENMPKYKEWMDQLQYFPYEARLLRAFYFFELARRYGDIAMPLTVLTAEEANTIKKTPFNEVVEFIVDECDECIAHLPETYAVNYPKEVGRVTKGFAMAVKSKTLLYAASKLHNPEMDKDKWIRSAKAALDIINTRLYHLEKENANNLASGEVVLFRMNTANSNFELDNFPLRFTNGKKTALSDTNFPTQNLVDAFETRYGYKAELTESGWVCDDPKFSPNSPYEHRDPRFYRTVLYNEAEFKGSKLELFVGGADDLPVQEGGSPTGYFLRKYIDPETSFETDHEVKKKHHWIIYRYAETLLTYAESMFEAFGDPDATTSELPKSARWALNEVRRNVEMPDTKATAADFREAVRNEWRVEFAFEDHRFWDIRRWKIGSETQREIYGVYITKDEHELVTYKKFQYEKRHWSDCKNLYPIPQREIFKNTNLLPQNPGW